MQSASHHAGNSQQEPAPLLALVRLEACVDRALGDLSVQRPLGGCVRIGPLPELRCDGLALREALTLVLAELLQATSTEISVTWEVQGGGQGLLLRGQLESDDVVARANERLRASGGSVWLERGPRNAPAGAPSAAASGTGADHTARVYMLLPDQPRSAEQRPPTLGC